MRRRERQTDRQTDTQTDRRTDREWKDRETTERAEKERSTDGQTNTDKEREAGGGGERDSVIFLKSQPRTPYQGLALIVKLKIKTDPHFKIETLYV